MSNKHKQYVRLSGLGFLNSNRLYLGADHILYIATTLFSEEYKRFYFKDIQTMITHKTARGKILNLIFSIFLIICLMPALSLHGGWAGFFYLITALFLMLLIINLIRGPTCICHIRTPIQTVRLPVLNRIRKTRRALAKLIPLIESSQGVLSRESLSNVQQDEEKRHETKKSLTAPRHEKGTYHIFLFSLLLADAFFIAIEIFYKNITLFSIVSTITVTAVTILLIISLIKQTGSDLYRGLKIITWSAVGFKCINFISSYIIYFYVSMTNPDIAYNQWELFKRVLSLSPKDSSWLMRLSIFNLSWSLIIGIPGLILIRKFRNEYESSQTSSESQNDEALTIELDYE